MLKEIKSLQNSLIKDVVKLHQKKYRENLILIEGKKAVLEAIEYKLKIEKIFTLEILPEFKNFEMYLVTDEIMKKISTTDSPATVIAIAKKPIYDIKKFLSYKKIILLDNIKDAGNLGTIIRASSAFGADGILLFNDTVDEYSPKTIRSTAGNMFKIPVKKVNMNELKEFKKEFNFIATVVNSNKNFSDYKPKGKLLVMFGSEADGLCNDLLNLADEKLTIKMANNVESLNLALCAGIVLYKLQE